MVAATPGRYPSGVVRVALAAFLLSLGSAAAAQLVDEIPLADVLEILEIDGKLLAVDARTGGELELNLRLRERVQWRVTRGRVGMVLTDQRVLGVAVASGTWQQIELQNGEQVAGHAELGDRVGLLLTTRRAIGFDGGSRNLLEASLGLRERVLATAVGLNVAVVITDRRALGLSPTVGGFFDTSIQLGERVERVVAESNLATVTTDRRLLIFRTPTGTWEIRLRNLR
jgi:hypothetical protein